MGFRSGSYHNEWEGNERIWLLGYYRLTTLLWVTRNTPCLGEKKWALEYYSCNTCYGSPIILIWILVLGWMRIAVVTPCYNPYVILIIEAWFWGIECYSRNPLLWVICNTLWKFRNCWFWGGFSWVSSLVLFFTQLSSKNGFVEMYSLPYPRDFF